MPAILVLIQSLHILLPCLAEHVFTRVVKAARKDMDDGERGHRTCDVPDGASVLFRGGPLKDRALTHAKTGPPKLSCDVTYVSADNIRLSVFLLQHGEHVRFYDALIGLEVSQCGDPDPAVVLFIFPSARPRKAATQDQKNSVSLRRPTCLRGLIISPGSNLQPRQKPLRYLLTF